VSYLLSDRAQTGGQTTPHPLCELLDRTPPDNGIMDAQEHKRTPAGPKAVYLLSGLVKCSCTKVMYVYHNSKAYVCQTCKTRISVADLDEIYQLYLKEYLDGINIADYRAQSDIQLQETKRLLEVSTTDRNRIAKRMNDLIELRLEGGLSKDRYMEQYNPLEERLQQLDKQLPQLEAEIDIRSMQLLSSDVVITEAKTLLSEWEQMEFDQKRIIVETITTGIEIGKEDITITLAYDPTLPQNPKNSSHHHRDSCS